MKYWWTTKWWPLTAIFLAFAAINLALMWDLSFATNVGTRSKDIGRTWNTFVNTVARLAAVANFRWSSFSFSISAVGNFRWSAFSFSISSLKNKRNAFLFLIALQYRSIIETYKYDSIFGKRYVSMILVSLLLSLALSSSWASLGPKSVPNPAILFCWKSVNCSFSSSFARFLAFQNI